MKWKEIYILVLFVLMIGCLSSCDQTRDDMKNNADQSETSDLVTDDVSVTVQDTQATEHKHIEAKGVRENAVAPPAKRPEATMRSFIVPSAMKNCHGRKKA